LIAGQAQKTRIREMNMTHADDLDVGHDLGITKTTRRAAGAGKVA